MKKLITIAALWIVGLFIIIGYDWISTAPESSDNNMDSIYKSVSEKVKNKMQDVLPPTRDYEDKPNLQGDSRKHILFISTDEQHTINDLGAILVLDPVKEEFNLIQLAEEGINLSSIEGLAVDDTQEAIEVVESELDLEVDHFIKLNGNVLPEMIDSMGGITISSSQGDTDASKEEIHLSGEETMEFILSGNQGSLAELEQMQRQMLVTEAVMEELTSSMSLQLATTMFSAVGDKIETDLGLGDLLGMFWTYARMEEELESIPANGDGNN
ncbi:hypothetical protein GMD78_04695 [Ornithinibacillus sp. L9]|uniref:Cell envelope-related transcriptional attenuator domain-containing protein n=1 Tax=Ornithinibacillus caprae TaxID=2678566 RepID=A0A6N8FIV3_9BACI|nr:LCP family protein [Ornithinibacillus caprae]MUK87699.1 hypothetical protein [Ornithinibacillus caprae]